MNSDHLIAAPETLSPTPNPEANNMKPIPKTTSSHAGSTIGPTKSHLRWHLAQLIRAVAERAPVETLDNMCDGLIEGLGSRLAWCGSST